MHVRDQTKQYLKFLLQLVLPSNRYNAMEIMKISSRFFVEEDQLFRRGYNQAPRRCLAGDKVILEEVHTGASGF